MREKLVRFSKEEHQKLLEVHKKFYPDSWKYVLFAETVMRLLKMIEIEKLAQMMEKDLVKNKTKKR